MEAFENAKRSRQKQVKFTKIELEFVLLHGAQDYWMCFIKKSNVDSSFNSVMRWLSEGRTHFDNPWWAPRGVFSVRYVGTQQVCSHMTWILSFCWVTVARGNWLPSKREVAKNGWYVHNILCVFAIDPFSRIQVWPLTQFFLFLFVKNHWFAWRANQWPLIGEPLFSSVPPSNSLVSVSDPWTAFLSWHSAIQGPSTCLVCRLHNKSYKSHNTIKNNYCKLWLCAC